MFTLSPRSALAALAAALFLAGCAVQTPQGSSESSSSAGSGSSRDPLYSIAPIKDGLLLYTNR